MLSLTPMDAQAGAEVWRGAVERAFVRANRQIHSSWEGQRIGAGVLAAVVHRPRRSSGSQSGDPRWAVHLGWVGDVRAYALAPGHSDLRLLTRDQDIYRSNLGMHAQVTVQHVWHELQPGHLLLLCSDGLVPKALDHRAIERILGARRGVETAARDLVAEALQRQRGSQDADNITAMVAQLSQSEGLPELFALSHQGLGRPDNQDAFSYSRGELPQFLVLADGMSKTHPGGPYLTEGKRAAQMAAQTILYELGASQFTLGGTGGQ